MSTTPPNEQREGRQAEEELLPSWDVPPPGPDGTAGTENVPVAIPIAKPVEGEVPLALPVAMPVSSPLPVAVPVSAPSEKPASAPVGAPPAAEVVEPSVPVSEAEQSTPPTTITCPACGASNPFGQAYCSDCGYYFSPADLAVAAGETVAAVAAAPEPLPRVQGRYELVELVCNRLGVERYRGLDHETTPPTAVMVVRQAAVSASEPPAEEPAEEVTPPSSEEIQLSFDDPSPNQTTRIEAPTWPSIGWERRLLTTLESTALPAQLDHFHEEQYEYLIEEVPQGQLLWDAWDDPDKMARQKYGHLIEVADLLHQLHQCGVIVEGLRPDHIVVDERGQVRLNTLSEFLPLPLPADVPVRGTLYTAPELMTGSGAVDARADLYSFGAMLYSLHVGRELNERTDFDKPGDPKPFIPRFPDAHPTFGRLMMKTFRREVQSRFPTDEASREEATGFLELSRTLQALQRNADHVRLEIAAWTNTGIVRTGNEDAFAVLHAIESRQEDLGEAALVILCDGMGGYEAGEIAAALTIKSLRENLSKLRPFSVAAGVSPFPGDPGEGAPAEGHTAPALNVDEVKQALKQALRDANREVFQAARVPGSKRRGMGCTAEAVYVDGRHVIVGHVGDSRTYHLHEGRLVQMTRDHTLVGRLVELGQLTPEEAEKHPRRNELQQAIGGQPDVEPGTYAGTMSPGDWVIVCSDGLTNHVSNKDLAQMLQSEATSAEMAARRLVNLTLIEGATDNVTVVVIRAT